MFLLISIIFVLCVLLLYKPLYVAHKNVYDEKLERNELLNDEEFRESVRRRRYAPLHILPTFRWYNNFDTLEGSSNCFSLPIMVTTTDEGVFDCTAVCNDERAVYFFVRPTDVFIINGSRLMSGGYCTMNSVPRNCNTETSLIVHSVNQWTCIAEDPRYFAGESNMIQMAGRQHSDQILPEELDKIVLYDNLLQRPVDITRNTFRTSWQDIVVSDVDGSEKPRFEVRCDALDIRHNRMFNNPLNTIECLPNVCTSVQWVHRDVKPIFETGECDCGDVNTTRVEHIDQHDSSSRCAGVTNRLNTTENSYQFRVNCLSLDTLVSEYTPHKHLCPPDLFNQNTDFAFVVVLNGVVPLSGNGLDEPTTRLWRETRNRIVWRKFDR